MLFGPRAPDTKQARARALWPVNLASRKPQCHTHSMVEAGSMSDSEKLPALPGEAEVVGWVYRGPWGGLIVTEEKPKHAPEAVPVVTLAALQAMQARAEAAERERDEWRNHVQKQNDNVAHNLFRAEAAEACVKVLEEALEPFAAYI